VDAYKYLGLTVNCSNDRRDEKGTEFCSVKKCRISLIDVIKSKNISRAT